MSMSLKQQKKLLRQLVKQKLLVGVDQATVRAESATVFHLVSSLPIYHRNATRISVYLSMQDQPELNTDLIVEDLLRQSASVFIPYCTRDHEEMRMVRLASIGDWKSLPVNSFGIKEPINANDREDALANGNSLDLILVPALAFDKQRYRIGHGKGYYDRFISSARKQNPNVVTIGLSLSCQLLMDQSVPRDEHDLQLDMVITPTTILS